MVAEEISNILEIPVTTNLGRYPLNSWSNATTVVSESTGSNQLQVGGMENQAPLSHRKKCPCSVGAVVHSPLLTTISFATKGPLQQDRQDDPKLYLGGPR